jgi:demethylmenaquinone methyltransferase/2-methoxy-6-polyprenyl-1,4-benzoquinol methylase
MKPIKTNCHWAGYIPDPAQRSHFTRALFDDTARYYDRINRVLSFGFGAGYRRQALLAAGLKPDMHVLDVATGTGLVAREAAALVDEQGQVVGLDLSSGMLRELRRHLDLPLIQGRAERLPVPEASFDFLSMGYALRHVADLERSFGEFRRVLKPGGTLLILEISRPANPLALSLARHYFGRFIPWMSNWLTGADRARTLMSYYWETIEHCVAPEAITAALTASRFTDVQCRVHHGIFRAYSAQK